MASRYYGRDLIDRFANDRHWKSTADFAKFLNEIEPNRSVDAWRVAILRWTREGNSFRNFDEVEDTTTTSTKTYYDSNNDKYIVMMEAVDGLILVDGEKHRGMKEEY